MDSDPLVTLEQARDLGAVRLAVIDVETSGLSPSEHHLLQVAVVVVDGHGRELRRWSSDIRPPRGLFGTLGPREIHGLTRWRLWRAPRVDEVLRHWRDLVADAVIAGHNVSFDLSFLREAGVRHGIALPDRPALCTLDLSRRLDPQRRRRHRLGDLCQHYGIDLDRPHDALADAQATASLLRVLMRDLDVEHPGDLAGLIRTQRDAA